MRIEGNFDIAASRDAVYRHITDPGLMARCVPASVAEALALLVRVPEAKIISGGATLSTPVAP